MNCEEMRAMIDESIDRELSAADEERLERHLDACPACRGERDEVEALVTSARELDREITPQRDLWAGIEGRIATTDGEVIRGPWYSSAWLGWAAAAVLVVDVYPEEARKQHLSGVVVVETLVKTDGTCQVMKVVESPDPILSDAASEALEQWKFEPGLDPQGKPVNMKLVLTIKFALK